MWSPGFFGFCFCFLPILNRGNRETCVYSIFSQDQKSPGPFRPFTLHDLAYSSQQSRVPLNWWWTPSSPTAYQHNGPMCSALWFWVHLLEFEIIPAWFEQAYSSFPPLATSQPLRILSTRGPKEAVPALLREWTVSMSSWLGWRAMVPLCYKARLSAWPKGSHGPSPCVQDQWVWSFWMASHSWKSLWR